MASVVIRLVDNDDGTVECKVSFDPAVNEGVEIEVGLTPAQRLGLFMMREVAAELRRLGAL